MPEIMLSPDADPHPGFASYRGGVQNPCRLSLRRAAPARWQQRFWWMATNGTSSASAKLWSKWWKTSACPSNTPTT